MIRKNIESYEIYTDGAAKDNNKRSVRVGGWSYAIWFDNNLILKDSGAIRQGTNNQMELLAVIEAIKAIIKFTKDAPGQTYNIYTDSAYVYNCWSQGWYIGWEANGWRNAAKQEVKNKELWCQLIPFFKRNDFHFHKVAGHTNNHNNNYVDELATSAAAQGQQGMNDYGGIPMWEDEEFLKCVSPITNLNF